MNWQIVIAIVIAIPVILFPAAYVWYMNRGGIYEAVKAARTRRLYHNREREITR
jgi:hypothetical protein